MALTLKVRVQVGVYHSASPSPDSPRAHRRLWCVLHKGPGKLNAPWGTHTFPMLLHTHGITGCPSLQLVIPQNPLKKVQSSHSCSPVPSIKYSFYPCDSYKLVLQLITDEICRNHSTSLGTRPVGNSPVVTHSTTQTMSTFNRAHLCEIRSIPGPYDWLFWVIYFSNYLLLSAWNRPLTITLIRRFRVPWGLFWMSLLLFPQMREKVSFYCVSFSFISVVWFLMKTVSSERIARDSYTS